MQSGNDIAEPLLEKLTPETRPLVQSMRGVVKDTLPKLEESVHLGWGVLYYRKPGGSMRDVVVAISPQRAYVNLEFADGIDLPDPAHKLEGTGKRLRHAKIRSVQDAEAQEVRSLLQAAGEHRGI